MKHVKLLLFFFLSSGAIFYIGSSYYNYYFDTSIPTIACSGIEQDAHYSGNMNIIITGSDQYKVKHFSVLLDEKILIDKQSVQSKSFEFPLLIPTIHLQNGQHNLKLSVTDNAKKENKQEIKIPFFVDNEPLEINIIKNAEFKINQGNVLHILLQSNKPLKQGYLKCLTHTVPFVLETPHSLIYEAFIPVGTEEVPGKYIASITAEDFVDNTSYVEIEYEIISINFKKQYIELKNKNIEKEQSLDTSQINDILEEAAKNSPNKKLWHGSFYRPCMASPVTTEFGVVRTSYERGRYRHDAIDFGARPKSPVWACQDGIIVIKDNEEINRVVGAQTKQSLLELMK
jgi:murein DD-endopeptidase MepM/ murein hydrolase activator NlpD